MRLFLSFLIVLLLLGTIRSATAQTSQEYKPDTSLTYSTFLKQCQSFTDRVRQEVWVVNFWDTNKPSLDSFTGLKQVYEEFRYKPIRFISISRERNRQIWINLLSRTDLQPPWEQLMVSSSSDYDFLTKAFRHSSLPGLFVVNSRGQVQRVRDSNHLRSVLAPMAQDLPDGPYDLISSKDVPGPADTPTLIDESVEPTPTTSQEDNWVFHTVRKGETLYRLKVRYGVAVEEIKSLNGLSNNEIKVGQVLKIKRR